LGVKTQAFFCCFISRLVSLPRSGLTFVENRPAFNKSHSVADFSG
jgi:hypothetical protein